MFYTADWNSIKLSAAAAYTWIETGVVTGTETDLYQVGASIMHKPSGLGIYGMGQWEESGGSKTSASADTASLDSLDVDFPLFPACQSTSRYRRGLCGWWAASVRQRRTTRTPTLGTSSRSGGGLGPRTGWASARSAPPRSTASTASITTSSKPVTTSARLASGSGGALGGFCADTIHCIRGGVGGRAVASSNCYGRFPGTSTRARL